MRFVFLAKLLTADSVIVVTAWTSGLLSRWLMDDDVARADSVYNGF